MAVSRFSWLGWFLVLAVGACSDDSSDDDNGGGSCGLNCAGTVNCDSGFMAELTEQEGGCAANGPLGTAILTCDGKITFDNGASQSTGTWSGSGTSYTVNWDAGNSETCTVTPP